jgi:hypothetical protein
MVRNARDYWVFGTPKNTMFRKQTQCPKRCVLYNTGRWTNSKNPVIPGKKQVSFFTLQNSVYCPEFGTHSDR